MACTHGLSLRHAGCSTLAAAMAESGASTLESSDSGGSGSSEGDESSDEVEIVVDSMKSTNLRGNNGM